MKPMLGIMLLVWVATVSLLTAVAIIVYDVAHSQLDESTAVVVVLISGVIAICIGGALERLGQLESERQ